MAKATRKSSAKLSAKTELKGNPLIPFIFILAGGIVIFIGGILVLAMGMMYHVMLSILLEQGYAIPFSSQFLIASGIVGLISGAIILSTAPFLYTKSYARFKSLVLVALSFSVISLISGGGFFIGFALAFIGAMAGLSKE